MKVVKSILWGSSFLFALISCGKKDEVNINVEEKGPQQESDKTPSSRLKGSAFYFMKKEELSANAKGTLYVFEKTYLGCEEVRPRLADADYAVSFSSPLEQGKELFAWPSGVERIRHLEAKTLDEYKLSAPEGNADISNAQNAIKVIGFDEKTVTLKLGRRRNPVTNELPEATIQFQIMKCVL